MSASRDDRGKGGTKPAPTDNGLSPPSTPKSHAQQEREVWSGMLQKRATSSPRGTPGSAADPDGPFSDDYPALVAFLQQTKWPDGKPRTTGTLLVFTQDGMWTLCLTDRDEGSRAFVTSRTLQEAFSEAEMGLRSDTLAWRHGLPSGQRRGK